GVQHPMDAGVLVRCCEAECFHHSQAELILSHAVRACVDHSTQDGAAQQADKQVVVEMSCLKRGVLAVVGETEQLSLLGGNAAGIAIHPLKGGRHEVGSCRASAFARKARKLAALAHAGMGLIQAAGTEPELARDEPETDTVRAI